MADAVLDTWTFDPTGALGQLAQSKRTINAVLERQEDHSYDALARKLQTDVTQNAGSGSTRTYRSSAVYDSYYGRVKAQAFPNNEAVWFRYGLYGQLTLESDAASGATYRNLTTVNARGQATNEALGPSFASQISYWPGSGQVQQIKHLKNGIIQRQLDYQYDVLGNVTRAELNAGQSVETLQYDALQRLTLSTRTGAATGSVSYGYDAAGTFTFKSDFSTTARVIPPLVAAVKSGS